MRKIIMIAVGAIAAAVGFVLPTLGVIDSNLTGALGALAIILSYVFFEAKADIKDILDGMSQLEKWSDPTFWIGLVSAILVYLSTELGWNLPTELIAGVLALIVPLLIKLFHKSEPDPVLRARLAKFN